MWQLLLTHTPLLYVVQSFWRDEAFSVLAAEKSIGFIITKLGLEPPIYYILLHFWIRIFGESDLVARCLSLLGFMLATWLMIEWAWKLYHKHWLSVFLPVFFFLNPMLLYYAFEVRTYAWYTFFATGMLFAYTEKRWGWFMLSAILGFYTHLYLLPFIGILFLHWWFSERHHEKAALHAFIITGIATVPWLIKVAFEIPLLKNSWYFPVDLQLVYSAIGNMFTGYEGTPWYGWLYTAYLSPLIIGFFLLALTDRKNRKRNVLFALFGIVPLAAVIGISFFKPLFVNRYLIPVTVSEVLVIVAGLAAIKNRLLQLLTAGVLMGFVLWFNWWFPPQHPKVPIRNTIMQVNALIKPSDVILADSSLNYLETLYYAADRTRVYLYDPSHTPFPWYVGSSLVPASRLVDSFPTYPHRAFLIRTDGSYQIVYQLPL